MENYRRNESLINDSEINVIDPCLYRVSRGTCKIETLNDKGSGFFIKLFKGDKPFYFLLTNEHILKKERVESKEHIKVHYDGEFKMAEIELNKNERIIEHYTRINIDATLVQILSEDNISEDYFLLPDLGYNISGYEIYKDKEIYLPQFPNGGPLSFSRGKIKEIKENYEFSHLSSTLCGSSGSPICLKNTTSVIGIHKAGTLNNTENYADFIGPIVESIKNFKGDFCIGKNLSEKKKATERITEEFEDLKTNQFVMVEVGLLNKNNIFNWICKLKAPTDSSYKKGFFVVRITFPENYPNSAPKLYFITPIYHLNINPLFNKLGHAYIDTSWWKPESTIRDFLRKIMRLFYDVDPHNAYGKDIVNEFKDNNPLYKEKAEHFTKKYASASQDSNLLYTGQNWDFHYTKRK